MKNNLENFKVGSKSDVKKLASAIAITLKKQESIQIDTIGAGALNQAVKAVAIARGLVATTGDEIIIIPVFTERIIDSEKKTCVKLIIKKERI